MKIAVIGSGIAGLSAAHHLTPHHLAGQLELTVFESAARTGGHANTVEVETESGTERVDTGFIVFNRRNYPLFSSMLEELEVASRRSEMSFSVSDGSGFGFAGTGLSGLFASRENLTRPGYLRMLAAVPRLQRSLRALIGTPDEITLGDFIERERLPAPVIELVLIPMVASVWSADHAALRNFPARFLAGFLENHGLLNLRDRPQWRTVDGGSRSYVDRLLEPISSRVWAGCRVEHVARTGDGVVVKPAGLPAEHFDQVIIATPAPRTLELLEDADPVERRFLSAFRFRANQAVLHTDPAVMPARRSAWASWNYRLGAGSEGLVALTYDMNRLQALDCSRRFFVSLNMDRLIDPSRILRTFTYDHPVFTLEAVSQQARWSEVSGRSRVHFAGAWLRNGFHEDGAVTGKRAAEAALAASPSGSQAVVPA